MANLTKTATWQRRDSVGVEQAFFDDQAGLQARGTAVAVTPVPYTCRYELDTDRNWLSVRLEVTVEGAGFSRTVRLERATGRWRVTAGERGDLDAALRAAGHPAAGMPGADDTSRLDDALDVDLAYSPLTNTLPVRRLGLLDAAPGTTVEVPMVFVSLPGLEVSRTVQTYRAGGPTVGFSSGTFRADLTVDPDGLVRHYPGLAERVD